MDRKLDKEVNPPSLLDRLVGLFNRSVEPCKAPLPAPKRANCPEGENMKKEFLPFS
jgi:hypothetical protein